MTGSSFIHQAETQAFRWHGERLVTVYAWPMRQFLPEAFNDPALSIVKGTDSRGARIRKAVR